MNYEYETFDSNIQRVKPNYSEICDIVATHTTEKKVWTPMDGHRVEITLYDLEDTMNVVKVLTETEHSFEVDNGFEVPIKITVNSRINPEL